MSKELEKHSQDPSPNPDFEINYLQFPKRRNQKKAIVT